MNKQELIEEIKNLENHNASKRTWVNRGVVLELVKELDEPQKPVVPQFVADWFEEHKDNLEFNIWDYVYRFKNQENTSFKKWFNGPRTEPFKTLVKMHLFGYKVDIEEEKRYRVKMKGIEGHNSYLKYNKNLKHWYFGSLFIYNNDVDTRTYHTHKELEEAGFCEVFNSLLFEVEEVEGWQKL